VTLEGDGGGVGRAAPVAEPNHYSVSVAEEPSGWEVRIIDPDGGVAWSRPCADAAEARTFASTVQQHIYWLSPEKFRAYYRLDA
jgi:hypothetical protein